MRAAALCLRSWAQWLLGYPEAALADADSSLKDAREIGQAGTLMFALAGMTVIHIFCGKYTTAAALADELVALAEENEALSRRHQREQHMLDRRYKALARLEARERRSLETKVRGKFTQPSFSVSRRLISESLRPR